jgi:hypothetical protein
MVEFGTPRRRAKRFLSAEQEYEIWLRILSGELTTSQAAGQAGVDRSTILTLRRVAENGAIAALQASRPGKPRDVREAGEVARFDWEERSKSACQHSFGISAAKRT